MERWHKTERRVVPTEDLNRSEDGEDGNEAQPWRRDGKTGVCKIADGVGNVVMAIVGCPSKANAAESAVETIL